MPSSVDTVSIRHVTSNFFFWQGLRWVGPGLSLILVAAGLNASLPHEWKRPLLAFALLLGVAGTLVAGRYYRRSFGTARVDPAMHEQRTLWKWAVVYPLMLVALSADIVLRPPVFVSGIVFAAGIEMYRRSTGGGRRHYIVASALFAMYTFAPLTGIVAPGRDALTWFAALLGFVYVAGGVMDHLALRRFLAQAGATSHEATI